MNTSLDPRFNRVELDYDPTHLHEAKTQDQFSTFEAFQLVKESKPFEHVGIVHAPDAEIAFLFAKEQYSRRGNTCLAMAIVSTNDMHISAHTEGAVNIMDNLGEVTDIPADAIEEQWVVFGLKKRGKHHIMLGEVAAKSPTDAYFKAKEHYYSSPLVNLWACKKTAILFTDEADKDIWNTLSDKKYRDAIAYKSADLINAYKQREGLL